MGRAFSRYCVGCGWALFAFIVVVGSINIVWMALIAVVLSVEWTVAWGARPAHVVGVLAGVAGVALVGAAVGRRPTSGRPRLRRRE